MRGRPLTLDELRQRAKNVFRARLREYRIPRHVLARLVEGSGIEGDDAIIDVYVPQNRPEDAIVLARATLNRWSGEGEIEVFEENIRRAADLTDEEPEVHGIDY